MKIVQTVSGMSNSVYLNSQRMSRIRLA